MQSDCIDNFEEQQTANCCIILYESKRKEGNKGSQKIFWLLSFCIICTVDKIYKMCYNKIKETRNFIFQTVSCIMK